MNLTDQLPEDQRHFLPKISSWALQHRAVYFCQFDFKIKKRPDKMIAKYTYDSMIMIAAIWSLNSVSFKRVREVFIILGKNNEIKSKMFANASERRVQQNFYAVKKLIPRTKISCYETNWESLSVMNILRAGRSR